MSQAAIRCNSCEKEREVKVTTKGLPRLPRGWKRVQDTVWCDTCWQENYVLRSIVLPIAAPLGADWKDLRAALRQCWSASTQLSNWAVTELAKADVVRTPDMDKLPPMPSVYLYTGARKILPEMDTASVVSVLQAVERRYRKQRFDIIWRRAASLPSYRYPTPYPVSNQRWSVREEEGHGLILNVPLAGKRWELRLRTANRHRQRAAVRKLINGEAVAGELSIYERGDSVMAKMVMWLPRRTAVSNREGTLYVRTAEDAVWEYHINEDDFRYYYADHVRRWIAAYKKQCARAIHDSYFESRKVSAKRKRDLALKRRKHLVRMDSWVHEATAMLAAFADRNRVARVVYDDHITSYAALPWSKLRTRLAYKLDELGIEFVHTNGSVSLETVD